MEALRIRQKPVNGVLTIKLPENLADSKQLDIVILPVDRDHKASEREFNPSDYFGIWKHKIINVDEVCRKMRDEWNRDF